ncbi:cyclic pyranopterin monophosphate synthase MoaC [Nitrospirota bacterium]
MDKKLSHIDDKGKAKMVDVSDKDITTRTATATGAITMKPETLALITDGNIPKGDVFAVARVAGIMATKKTPELIPLCHPLAINSVDITMTSKQPNKVLISATVRCSGKTGVEMEALTAVSTTALTIYDMCKAVDKDMVISDIALKEKSGGKSGIYKRT